MPTQRLRKLKATEDQEYRHCLSFLEKRRIGIGAAGDPSPKPDRLILEPINHGFARCFELPWGQVVVVAPVADDGSHFWDVDRGPLDDNAVG